MANVKSIHHVAVVVSDMEASLAFWRDALGIELRDKRDVVAENSQVAFLPVGASQLELVLPTTDDSGIARYLAKRGPGMHHICLEVEDLDSALKRLKEKGIRLITDEARLGADGRRYAFVHPDSSGGVLVELYQS
jgi:methylmalonyl-CoA/ethylmalonyl-CoA epimerase